MSPAFERLQKALRNLPGLGYRSAERIALHLVVEKPSASVELAEALAGAAAAVGRCPVCGNLCEGDRCSLCADHQRNAALVCVVERVPDLIAVERSGAFRGLYHVLHGRLSPMHGVGPSDLNLASLEERVRSGVVKELILALSNDIEGEATAHYIAGRLAASPGVSISRIGFGLPSGGGLVYADATTLKSALDGRRGVSGPVSPS
jgi:recombination protein RecR